MKLTAKARKALRQSVKHWEKDICKPLREGREFDVSGYWIDNDTRIQDTAEYCALCTLYLGEDDNYQSICSIQCPYKAFYGIECDCDHPRKKSHWRKWRNKRSIKTAEAMRDALQRILDEETP